MKTHLITGITGQDGAYLAQLLLDRGDKVFGTFRRSSSVNFWRLQDLGVLGHPNLELVEFDLTDASTAIRLVDRCAPDRIFNLAAQSFVGVSFDQPVTTAEITGIGAVNLLEAIRIVNRNIRFYQASTSEMFGMVQQMPQTESTPFYPRSPYGVAKLYAHWMTVNYREAYGIFGASGILFNHESPLRGKEFVTRKITDAVSRIATGALDCVELGNLDAQRDWGFAGDYVVGMAAMLEVDTPDTFVLATNRTVSVRDFVSMSFAAIEKTIIWDGKQEAEFGRCAESGAVLVKINPQFYRPAEVDLLIGDATHADMVLGWKPQMTLETLCANMVEADLKRVASGRSW